MDPPVWVKKHKKRGPKSEILTEDITCIKFIASEIQKRDGQRRLLTSIWGGSLKMA